MFIKRAFSTRKFLNNLTKSFSTNTQFYVWFSSTYPGLRTDDYKNKLTISSKPKKIDFFDGKNVKDFFMGPRHSAVITESGDLYTFGSGNWGILGHGNEESVKFNEPKLVEYFKENNIKVSSVCMGDFHTLVLSEEGEMYSWGFGGKKGLFSRFLWSGNSL